MKKKKNSPYSLCSSDRGHEGGRGGRWYDEDPVFDCHVIVSCFNVTRGKDDSVEEQHPCID